MKAVVIGAGEVGLNIARHLVMENQDVVLVDNDPAKLAAVGEVLDVQTIEGFGSHPDVLEAAGCENAAMLIAVTHSDEVNMVACQMAYSLFNVPLKIARVRQPAYLEVTKHRLYTRDHMPVDVIISPEVEVANAIIRTMTVPGAFDAEFFGNGRVAVIGTWVTAEASLIGKPLFRMHEEKLPFTVAGIFRGERLIVPDGQDHLELDDEVFIICRREDTEEAMQMLGHMEGTPKDVFIIGGGGIGHHILQKMEKMGITARVLERDSERAAFLADTLHRTTVLHGDALDRKLLMEENIQDMDAVVAVTSDDATNILSSKLVSEMGVNNVITLVNQSNFISMVESLGVETVISPREITASRILQYIRRGHILSLHSIKDGKAEVIEAEATPASPIVGVPIRELSLPAGIILGAVISGSQVTIPRDGDIIHAGDRVVLFCANTHIHTVESLF
ncbi:MAG: Trk system potassium transporter TrkA [Proteobacteria bacterium]|nr:Trk system potassium transporter TrkA [Pseudomonadota bacterium]